MDSEHTRQLIPDYVLGLLSADDRRRVEQHARQCPLCREAIQRERQVEFRVRGAVQLAARPPAGRLEALRPAFPQPAARGRGPLYRPLAPAMALTMLLVVVLLARVGGYGLSTPGLTSTATHTPTATLATTDAPPTAQPTAAPATLTRVSWSSAPPPPSELAPGYGANPPSSPAAAATPIITLAR